MQEDAHHHFKWLVRVRDCHKKLLVDIDLIAQTNINIAPTLLVDSVLQPQLPSRQDRVARDGVLVCNLQSHLTLAPPVSMLAIVHLVGDYLYPRLRIHSSHHMDMAHLH
jgi:hypothetical protein